MAQVTPQLWDWLLSTNSRGWVALMEGGGQIGGRDLWISSIATISCQSLLKNEVLFWDKCRYSTSAGSFRRKEALKADFQNIIQGKNKTCFLVSRNLLELLLYSPFFYIKQILPEKHNLLLHRSYQFLYPTWRVELRFADWCCRDTNGSWVYRFVLYGPVKILPQGMFEIPTTGATAFIFNLCNFGPKHVWQTPLFT